MLCPSFSEVSRNKNRIIDGAVQKCPAARQPEEADRGVLNSTPQEVPTRATPQVGIFQQLRTIWVRTQGEGSSFHPYHTSPTPSPNFFKGPRELKLARAFCLMYYPASKIIRR
jgi:hypothetical protein